MTVKLVHISDTHLKPFNPESGNILIHSGDFLNHGGFNDLIRFRSQLVQVFNNYNHIILVPGNHDRIFEEAPQTAEEVLKELVPNIHILHNKGIELLGLKFYGTADQKEFCNWAFNKSPEKLTKSYSNIPDDTEVLITHAPAYGIRDVIWGESVGSPELNLVYPRLKKLKAHLFGHIHFSRGMHTTDGVIYSNGAMVDERYEPGHKENIIELSIS